VVVDPGAGEDGGVEPEPGDESITVWRVELERGVAEHDVKGLLSIDESCLRFVEETGAHHRIELTQVRKVRKLTGTPVVIVEHEEPQPTTRPDASISRTAFYFAKPPPLTMTTRRGVESKRKARRSGAHYLGASNAARKHEIREWVARLREAVAGG
jgi:hypothetical protein